MQYHPHGDVSIKDALVLLLTTKRFVIEGQGNFGNLYTGDAAASGRYIECRLTDLARQELFNDEVTDFVPSYDGRSKEPVTLPSKLPLLLMLGTEGIAVGMAARILPHNFPELLEAQIAILKNQPFKVLPDFPTGGIDGRARISRRRRASQSPRPKIKIKDDSTVVIKEIPPGTTTESLIASIEDASRKGKIKVKSLNDFTAGEPEIEVRAPNGVSADQVGGRPLRLHRLRGHHFQPDRGDPRQSARGNDRFRGAAPQHRSSSVAILKRELELKERKLEQELHFKTLVRLFVEKRIYKGIEQARTNEAVVAAVRGGLPAAPPANAPRPDRRGHRDAAGHTHPAHFSI
jgi:topoisomerase-4 subunit A